MSRHVEAYLVLGAKQNFSSPFPSFWYVQSSLLIITPCRNPQLLEKFLILFMRKWCKNAEALVSTVNEESLKSLTVRKDYFVQASGKGWSVFCVYWNCHTNIIMMTKRQLLGLFSWITSVAQFMHLYNQSTAAVESQQVDRRSLARPLYLPVEPVLISVQPRSVSIQLWWCAGEKWADLWKMEVGVGIERSRPGSVSRCWLLLVVSYDTRHQTEFLVTTQTAI